MSVEPSASGPSPEPFPAPAGLGAGPACLPPGFLPDKPADGRYRVLFVHAHPDDETWTGATMALLASIGVDVYLLTATRGELGEVIPEQLRHLEQGLPKPGRGGVSIPDGGAALAQARTEELAEAARALGVTAWAFVGQPPALAAGAAPLVYRDSGMQWGPDGRAQAADTATDDSFSRRPFEELVAHVEAAILTIRPDVVVTYGADGGYGHPDHVRTYEVTMGAVEKSAHRVAPAKRGPGVQAPQLGAGAWDVPLVHTIRVNFDAAADALGSDVLTVEGLLEPKRQAMRAHRTQVVVDGDEFALSNGARFPLLAREQFVTVRRGSGTKPSRWQTIAAALAGGFMASMLGTVLHNQVTNGVSWGVVAALGLVVALMVFVGSWARSVSIGALAGVATYGGCILWSLPRGQVGLIMSNVTGNLWAFGIPVVTILFYATAVFLHRRKTHQS